MIESILKDSKSNLVEEKTMKNLYPRRFYRNYLKKKNITLNLNVRVLFGIYFEIKPTLRWCDMVHSCRKTIVSMRNLDVGAMYVLDVAGVTAPLCAGAKICIRFDAFTGFINPFILAVCWAVIFDGADRIRLPCIVGVT